MYTILLGCLVQWSKAFKEAFKEGSGVGNLEKKASLKIERLHKHQTENPLKNSFFEGLPLLSFHNSVNRQPWNGLLPAGCLESPSACNVKVKQV
jgi:hypothetical protein